MNEMPAFQLRLRIAKKAFHHRIRKGEIAFGGNFKNYVLNRVNELAVMIFVLLIRFVKLYFLYFLPSLDPSLLFLLADQLALKTIKSALER